MSRSRLLKPALIVAGLVALIVGAAVLFAPEALHASAGVELAPDPSLMSEIRAPGGALLGAGLLMLLGAFVERLARPGLLVALIVYLGYGGARLVSLALDGAPAPSLLAALAIELAIGLFCLAALRPMRPAASSAFS